MIRQESVPDIVIAILIPYTNFWEKLSALEMLSFKPKSESITVGIIFVYHIFRIQVFSGIENCIQSRGIAERSPNWLLNISE